MSFILALGLATSILTSSGSQPVEIRSEAHRTHCTAWKSHYTPPDTIRVLLPYNSNIVEVPLKTYVLRVMAAGAWPGTKPIASLRAGAIAIKQYAWHEILHWTPDKMKRNRCYDIRNGGDEGLLYRPKTGLVHWNKKQLSAVESTWYWSIRKNDRLFRTGYRGYGGKCGSMVDGWHLFEDGVTDCARRGKTLKQILDIYYGPRYKLVIKKL
jgi:hypothetical protein